ncbi:ABC-2 family transporter protein [Actinomyces naeslundii str. Howell 279]|uniref:ABC-2 family transporter protein n=1 Tax=Actinomyces naeslundii (strain ATCC 12104 / DSM 43013 / CCUG 2238 / JCM 8349 / NCTC 10301 / Howell 279) TaxID=1115803 RepID=J3A9I1_ACTNH|nr:ABC-2 family transporter protein [Actinomyces naeslundii str. Howell 279]
MTANAPTTPVFQAPAKTTANAASNVFPRRTGVHIQGRQTILRSVRAEWIKLWTLRSTWITSFIAIALTVLFGAGLAAAFGQSEQYQDTAKESITAGLNFGQIVVAVLGALIITGEYSSGQIRSSLAAVPKRGRLLLSKAVVLAVVSFILGSVSVFLSWAISKPFLGEHAGSLTDAHYAGYIWGSGLAYAVIALMTLGIGFLLRSTAGAITVIVSLLFVVASPSSSQPASGSGSTRSSAACPAPSPRPSQTRSRTRPSGEGMASSSSATARPSRSSSPGRSSRSSPPGSSSPGATPESANRPVIRRS